MQGSRTHPLWNMCEIGSHRCPTLSLPHWLSVDLSPNGQYKQFQRCALGMGASWLSTMLSTDQRDDRSLFGGRTWCCCGKEEKAAGAQAKHVKRVHQLLANAPTDRAWRRRATWRCTAPTSAECSRHGRAAAQMACHGGLASVPRCEGRKPVAAMRAVEGLLHMGELERAAWVWRGMGWDCKRRTYSGRSWDFCEVGEFCPEPVVRALVECVPSKVYGRLTSLRIFSRSSLR